MEQKVYNIVIADDHEIILNSLTKIIDAEANMQIVAGVKNGVELIDFVNTNMPDLCIVDLDMPVMNGLAASKKLLDNYPDIKIIIFTMYNLNSLIRRIKNMGIKAYLIKSCDRDELIFAINQVVKGRRYFSGGMLVNTPLNN